MGGIRSEHLLGTSHTGPSGLRRWCFPLCRAVIVSSHIYCARQECFAYCKLSVHEHSELTALLFLTLQKELLFSFPALHHLVILSAFQYPTQPHWTSVLQFFQTHFWVSEWAPQCLHNQSFLLLLLHYQLLSVNISGNVSCDGLDLLWSWEWFFSASSFPSLPPTLVLSLSGAVNQSLHKPACVTSAFPLVFICQQHFLDVQDLIMKLMV